MCGYIQVIIRPNVRRFTETNVEFEDGTVVENIDASRERLSLLAPVTETGGDRREMRDRAGSKTRPCGVVTDRPLGRDRDGWRPKGSDATLRGP